MFRDTSILLRQCPWICKVQLWKFLKDMTMPVQDGGGVGGDVWSNCPSANPRGVVAPPLQYPCATQTTEFSMKPKSQTCTHTAVQCSSEATATPRGCQVGSVLKKMLHTRYVQCAKHNVAWQCNMCRVDLCAGSITQSIAHLVGRYYLLIFIEFSLLFSGAQLCTRHCHAHRG